LLVGVGFAGAGLASVFPTTLAMLPRCFGGFASKVAGPVFALAGLGGATIPWSVGALSDHFGRLQVGLFVPLVANFLMIALQIGIISALVKKKS
jgi:fucose permease